MRRGRIRTLFTAALLASTLLVPATGTTASSVTTTNGTWTDCNLDPVVREAGRVTLFGVTITETLSGDLTGTYVGKELDIIRPDGSVILFGSGTFTGTVAGRSGTAAYRYSGSAPDFSSFTARWVVSNGRGGLAGISGGGTFGGVPVSDEGCPAGNAGAYAGSYTGAVRFGR